MEYRLAKARVAGSNPVSRSQITLINENWLVFFLYDGHAFSLWCKSKGVVNRLSREFAGETEKERGKCSPVCCSAR